MHDANAASMDEMPEQGIDALLRYASEINIPLDDNQLNALGQRVVRDAEEDDQSRSDWRDKYDHAQSLVKLDSTADEGREGMWGSQVNYPLLTEASMSFANRALSAVFDDKTIVTGMVNGDDPDNQKQDRADRVAEHINYQLTYEMPEWEPDTRRLLHMLPHAGCVFRKVWWSAREARPISCLIRPEHFIVNNNISDLRSAPRMTMRFPLWPHEIREHINAGLFTDDDYGIDPEREEEQEFYEQMRRIDLDEDGYPEPYIVTVHKDSAKVARVKACFGTRIVYNMGGPLVVSTQQGMQRTTAKPGDIILRDDQVQQIVPLQYYIKYGLLPAPDGTFYDWGFGHIIGDLNEAVSTLLRQMIDAGTLRNAGGGLLSRAFKGRQETIHVSPGEWASVDVSSEDLQKGVLPNPNPDPSPMGLQLIEILAEASRTMTTQSDVASGDVAAQMAPTTMMALADQALTGFRGIFKGVWQSLSDEVKIVAHLNRLFLEEDRYFRFHDSQQAIAPQDYADEDMDVVPSASPDALSPMQKASRAQMLIGMIGVPGLDPAKLLDEAFRLLKFGDVESYAAQPQPPGPEQQLAVANVRAEVMKKIAEIEHIKARTVRERTQAIGDMAEAEKDMAEAQSEALTRPYDELIQNLRLIEQEAKSLGAKADAETRIRGMAQAPGNAGFLQGPRPTQG